MGGSTKSNQFPAKYYTEIRKIEPYFLKEDDLVVDFVATVEKLRKDPLLRLDKQAMLLRPPSSYQPTSEEKLKKLLEGEVKAYSYNVKYIKKGYYELKRYEYEYWNGKGEKIEKMPVNKLISTDLNVVVDTDEEVAAVEAEFWNVVEENSHDAQYNDDKEYEPEDDGVTEESGFEDEDFEKKKRKRKHTFPKPAASRGKGTRKNNFFFKKLNKRVMVRLDSKKEEEEGSYEYNKFLALYGSDNEGSLYDHRSEKFNMIRFPNILPQVTHQYSETVSGVTTPMLYVGQKYAPFPPHVEDNEAWSINYLHKGNPKIWYVLEVTDARNFEKAMEMDLKSNICKICRDCPCILRHKGHLLHPDVVAKHGYVVSKITQRAGDIVLLPPRCYHWGFNASDNVAEAINFTLPDSLPFGFLAISCPEKAKEHPIYSMEWFVWALQPEKYADYVNGTMMLSDPVTHELCKVPPPKVKKTLDDDNVGLLAGGILKILAAKNQDGKDWLYVNSAAGYSWIPRELAEESLYWNTIYGERRIILRPEIFSMKPEVMCKLGIISECWEKGDNEGADRIIDAALGMTDQEECQDDYMDADDFYDTVNDNIGTNDGVEATTTTEEAVATSPTTSPAIIATTVAVQQVSTTFEVTPVKTQKSSRKFKKTRVPWQKVEPTSCQHCNKMSTSYTSKKHWNRHLQSCAGTNKIACNVCGKIVRKDNLKDHVRKRHPNMNSQS